MKQHKNTLSHVPVLNPVISTHITGFNQECSFQAQSKHFYIPLFILAHNSHQIYIYIHKFISIL